MDDYDVETDEVPLGQQTQTKTEKKPQNPSAPVKPSKKLEEKPQPVAQIEESKGNQDFIEPIPVEQPIIHWSKVKAEAEISKAKTEMEKKENEAKA